MSRTPETNSTASTVQRPSVGSKVAVTINNISPLHVLFYRPPTMTFIGTVVNNFPWCDPGDMCMTADDGTDFVRRIKLERVLKIEPVAGGRELTFTPEAKIQEDIWQIRGSKGDTYTVSLISGHWRCDCMAGQHGRACKHVKEAQGKVAAKT